MDPRDVFETIAAALFAARKPGEEMLLAWDGEDSDFVRWNRARIRQAGTVSQRQLTVRLIHGARHAALRLTVADGGPADRDRIASALPDLRQAVASSPDDPHLLWNREPISTERRDETELAESAQIVDDIAQAGEGLDLVGLLAQGPVYAGFASSLGQRNWFESRSFSFEWCLYARADKATKQSYAGSSWDGDALRERMEAARERLRALERPGRRLEPGRYRAWLAPAAVGELVSLLSWNGFGLKAKQTRRSGLQRAIDGKASFSPRFALTEATAGGLAPPFSPFGFVRPDAVSLIADGRPQDPLVSPRSAREYGVPTNGASDDESPQSAAVAGGTLADADVLRELGTGLWVPNLWYLNWSDRTACRATGMTRFATMWVEDGRIVCPVDVMRFDAVLYDLLGAGLVAFGERVELMPDTSTYERRSTASLRAPGALVDGLTFTL